MFEIMEATGNGVGLTAPQIGCSERLVVAQVRMPSFPKDFPEKRKEALKKKILGLSKTIIRTDHTQNKIKELEDKKLTEAKREESKQKAKQEGREFKPSEKTFWISEKNKEKALAIIGKTGGEDYILDDDTLLSQSETADNAVEAKSETR